MKILTVSALFPPSSHGGTEDSAYNLATWLQKEGHEVTVLTTASSEQDILSGTTQGGLKIWRVLMPRPYPIFHFPKANQWLKPLWHFLDHFHPHNKTTMGKALDEIKPDVALVHFIQGLGYNSLREIARRNIPTVFFLHDLGLACVRMSMFHKGQICQKQCMLCKASSWYKAYQIRHFSKIGFCSPSRANLDKLAQYFPVLNYPHTSILNANQYPTSTSPHTKSNVRRFVFVGRLHHTKGVDVLLQAAERLSTKHALTMTIIGDGPEAEPLKSRFGHHAWCKFTGRLTQGEIAAHMADSDVFCIPSVWFENSPGVAIHALLLGLPVIGSNIGGIPELVKDGRNGLLVKPGDVDGWENALHFAIRETEEVAKWQEYARSHAFEFNQEHIARKILFFINSIVNG